jgi:hypothetical protein
MAELGLRKEAVAVRHLDFRERLPVNLPVVWQNAVEVEGVGGDRI